MLGAQTHARKHTQTLTHAARRAACGAHNLPRGKKNGDFESRVPDLVLGLGLGFEFKRLAARTGRGLYVKGIDFSV